MLLFQFQDFLYQKNTLKNFENKEVFIMKSSTEDLDHNADSQKLGLCCKHDTITSYQWTCSHVECAKQELFKVSTALLVHFVAPVQPLKRVGAKTLKQHYVTCFKNHSNVTVTYNRVNGVFVSALLWCIAPSDGLNLPLQNPTITKHSLHFKTSIAGTISVWKPWHERPSSSMQELLLCKQMQNTPSL